MVGQLGQIWPGLDAVQGFECADSESMQADAARSCQSFVERVADQDVHETQPTQTVRCVGDHTCGHRLVERVEHVILSASVESGERVEPEFAAEDAGEKQYLIAMR